MNQVSSCAEVKSVGEAGAGARVVVLLYGRRLSELEREKKEQATTCCLSSERIGGVWPKSHKSLTHLYVCV